MTSGCLNSAQPCARRANRARKVRSRLGPASPLPGDAVAGAMLSALASRGGSQRFPPDASAGQQPSLVLPVSGHEPMDKPARIEARSTANLALKEPLRLLLDAFCQ